MARVALRARERKRELSTSVQQLTREWGMHRACEIGGTTPERVFIDNLLVRIHLIIELILVDRPCAMGD